MNKRILKIRESDLEILEVATNETRANILNNILATIIDIESKYRYRIKPSWQAERNIFGFKYFRSKRVYKIKDRPKGINLYYSLFYQNDGKDLHAYIYTRRSKFGRSTLEQSEKDIIQMVATETIESMLIY
jgi:hypothetical protein